MPGAFAGSATSASAARTAPTSWPTTEEPVTAESMGNPSATWNSDRPIGPPNPKGRGRAVEASASACLFPFDGARRLGGDVVDNAVDLRDLVDDAVADAFEYVCRQSRPVRCHCVLAR